MADDSDIRAKLPCDRADALAVLTRLRGAGHIAYFAGGCVRDLMLGLEPTDYDVATDAPPRRVRELFSNTQAVGAAFGVVLVRHGTSSVEVSTFRAEGKYLDGRRPSEVRFTSVEQDALRRDFTINGLYMDPLNENQVIDLVGGLDDLAARRLRAVGQASERFSEDHLRLLRAVRFAARFGLEIEPATASAILAAAPLLKGISPERIANELRLMLTPPTRAVAWPLLWRFRLIDVILRFVPMPQATFSPARSIFLATAPGARLSFGLALAAGVLCAQYQALAAGADLRQLFQHPAARKLAHAVDKALRLSNIEFDEMQQTIESLAPLLADEPQRLSTLKRFLADPTAAQSRKLLDALDAVGLFSERINSLRHSLVEAEKTNPAPPPLITGDDLTAAGLSPGPQFKCILESVYDAQLEGAVTTREEALRMALQMRL